MNRVLPLVALVLGSCGAVRTAPEVQLTEIETLTRKGDYRTAAELSVDLLQSLPADDPLRPEAEQAGKNITVASGLEQARELSLSDDDDAALAILHDLDTRFPDTVVVTAWIDRTSRKLADRWFKVAREALANEHFEAARAAYRMAIKYEPDHPVAPAGLARLRVVEDYRAGLAEDYYYDGVRTFTDLKLAESDNSFEKSRKYDEEEERTKQRIAEVRREQAKGRVAYAEQLVADRRYAAARAEYAEAARLDPKSEDIAERLAAMRIEAEVAATLSEAESFLLRKEFDKGEALIREAGEKTAFQADLVRARLEGIDDSRIDARYQRAIDLEHDFRFPEAIAAYEAILELRDFYLDVRSRIDALEGYVRDAERIYAEAEAAADDATKLELYRQIELFWPDYLDVPDKIRALDGR